MPNGIDQKICALVAAHGKEGVRELVTQWCNASEVDVNDDGGIWIAHPQTGHWLGDDKRAEFANWCDRQ